MTRALAIILAGALMLGAAKPEPEWRNLDARDTLVIDTTKGRIVVEMAPQLAPLAVERVKLLARECVYDGLLFHRVIEGFVDQTGNPNNKDGGTSSHPNLPPEFMARLPDGGPQALVTHRTDGVEGYLGAVPIAGVGAAEQALGSDHRLRVWGAYCQGVAGMGRQAAIDTANSEIFFMRSPARRLDHDYAVWGVVVAGLDVVRAVAVGEPPQEPDRMLKVRVAADLPPGERPQVQVMNTRSTAFHTYLANIKAKSGASFTICDAPVPVRTK